MALALTRIPAAGPNHKMARKVKGKLNEMLVGPKSDRAMSWDTAARPAMVSSGHWKEGGDCQNKRPASKPPRPMTPLRYAQPAAPMVVPLSRTGTALPRRVTPLFRSAVFFSDPSAMFISGLLGELSPQLSVVLSA